MAFEDDTLRLQILKHIKGLYEAVTDEDPAPPGKVYYGMNFSVVGLGPLSDADHRKRFSLGIIPGPELKSDLFPLKTAMFTVTLEFKVTIQKSDPEPLEIAERVLGVVQQVMYDNDRFGDLIIKHDEIANEQDMFTYTDRAIGGMVQFRIHYRHGVNTVYDGQPVHF